MMRFLFAVIIALSLSFASIGQMVCNDGDCLEESMQIEKKTDTKALHACGCHHHTTSFYETAAAPALVMDIAPDGITSADLAIKLAPTSPLLEPPSFA